MGFESGSISFRMLYMPGGLPSDFVTRFAASSLPPIDTLGHDEISGWVTSRHLLDSRITEESVVIAGYPRVTLCRAERKIPEALMRAECRMLELAELAATERSSVPRERKTEIKKEVIERLLPQMPPTLTGIPIVYDSDRQLVYAGATSDKQQDALVIALRETLGVSAVPLTPEALALKDWELNARDLKPTSFSEQLEDQLAGDSLGQDFLTWLWFHSEVRGGMTSTDRGHFAAAVDGPLTFVLEGDGAHVMQLRKGSPLVSAEAKTALESGKKLSQAKILMARSDDAWQFTLGAGDFTFRSTTVPKADGLDPVSRFQERMMALDTMLLAFNSFFGEFLSQRFDPGRWAETVTGMRGWVADRMTRI